MDEASERYIEIGQILGLITGTLTFIGSWIYCASEYGFLLGFGLGWLPSGILAFMIRIATVFLWGPAVLLIGAGIILVLNAS